LSHDDTTINIVPALLLFIINTPAPQIRLVSHWHCVFCKFTILSYLLIYRLTQANYTKTYETRSVSTAIIY